MMPYGVILFHTTSAVLRAEKLLLKEKLSIKLVPTPRQFSSDCGIALRFDWSHREAVSSILAGAKVEFDSIHFLDTKPV
jgi:hypothetical protein